MHGTLAVLPALGSATRIAQHLAALGLELEIQANVHALVAVINRHATRQLREHQRGYAQLSRDFLRRKVLDLRTLLHNLAEDSMFLGHVVEKRHLDGNLVAGRANHSRWAPKTRYTEEKDLRAVRVLFRHGHRWAFHEARVGMTHLAHQQLQRMHHLALCRGLVLLDNRSVVAMAQAFERTHVEKQIYAVEGHAMALQVLLLEGSLLSVEQLRAIRGLGALRDDIHVFPVRTVLVVRVTDAHHETFKQVRPMNKCRLTNQVLCIRCDILRHAGVVHVKDHRQVSGRLTVDLDARLFQLVGERQRLEAGETRHGIETEAHAFGQCLDKPSARHGR